MSSFRTTAIGPKTELLRLKGCLEDADALFPTSDGRKQLGIRVSSLFADENEPVRPDDDVGCVIEAMEGEDAFFQCCEYTEEEHARFQKRFADAEKLGCGGDLERCRTGIHAEPNWTRFFRIRHASGNERERLIAPEMSFVGQSYSWCPFYFGWRLSLTFPEIEFVVRGGDDGYIQEFSYIDGVGRLWSEASIDFYHWVEYWYVRNGIKAGPHDLASVGFYEELW